MTSAALQRKGLAITALGVMILTVDTVLLRFIDGDQWSVMFWRSLFMGGALFLWWAVHGRNMADQPGFFNGRDGWIVAICYAVSNICFIISIHNTSVANVLFILALAPLVAALLSIAVLGEHPKPSTWIAIIISAIGVGFIVSDGIAQGNIYGNSLAFGSALGLAAAFVMTRKSGKNMVTAPGVGALITAAFAVAFVRDFTFSAEQWAYISLNGLIILPLSFGLIAIGPKYITPAEVAMLMLLETVFAPVMVWFAIGEAPSQNSLIGGSIVVATLIIHSFWQLHRAQAR